VACKKLILAGKITLVAVLVSLDLHGSGCWIKDESNGER